LPGDSDLHCGDAHPQMSGVLFVIYHHPIPCVMCRTRDVFLILEADTVLFISLLKRQIC